jgi:endoglucanase
MCVAASALVGTLLGDGDATGLEALQDERQAQPPALIAEPVKVETMLTPTADVEVAFAMNRRLGRGVNLGNALEAPREGEWGVYLTEKHFDLIPEAGFDSVRIPIRWSARAASEPPYTIKPEFFERIDWAIDQALARGLVVVINTHHYEELYADPQGHRDRFLALWAQIGERYQDYPDELLFEPLNEPHGNMTAPIWNSLLQEVINTIRKTNPYRILVVGPANWNNIDALNALQLPKDDRRLIVTFHYYNPFHFTHQGAEWVQGSDVWLGTRWRGNTGEKRAVDRDLDRAAAWGEAHGRPLYMGEFGAYSRADMESRILWTAYVARQAEVRGITWAYWELCAGFGVYDQAREEWNRPLLEALLPRP